MEHPSILEHLLSDIPYLNSNSRDEQEEGCHPAIDLLNSAGASLTLQPFFIR
ncbi:hypothetical protein KP509_28G023000 [Ceratopteris richardii]|uniref:Uncharacterized protein n=1 Tax=Ceratopteris richardii TaxID=49495 RepID=A0A8T2RCW3_CERRI|nr:hypothetical protein KP509_28G023000 [Ceratopteris richardii]